MTNKVDQYAGKILKQKRLLAQMSQTKLGDELGITFQQIQKYENGSNRMSVSRLHKICELLRCEPSEFFPEKTVILHPLADGMLTDVTKKDIQFLHRVRQLPVHVQRNIKGLVAALSDDYDGGPEIA